MMQEIKYTLFLGGKLIKRNKKINMKKISFCVFVCELLIIFDVYSQNNYEFKFSGQGLIINNVLLDTSNKDELILLHLEKEIKIKNNIIQNCYYEIIRNNYNTLGFYHGLKNVNFYPFLGYEKRVSKRKINYYLKQTNVDIIINDTSFIFRYIYPYCDDDLQKYILKTYSNLNPDSIFSYFVDVNKKYDLSWGDYYTIKTKRGIFFEIKDNEWFLSKVPIDRWFPNSECVYNLKLTKIRLFIPFG